MDTDSEDRSESDSAFNEDTEALIDLCADHLASMDTRGRRRALLLDANAVLDRVLFPMCFPWSHRVDPPIQNLPRDIDELHEICSTEDNQYDSNHALQSSTAFREMEPRSSRSQDVGIVEVVRSSELEKAKNLHAAVAKKRQYPSDGSEAIRGELTLRIHEEVVNRKRPKIYGIDQGIKTALLSVRCGGSSSRSTLFDDVPSGMSALVLPALLLREVSEGRHVNYPNAKLISDRLGSYDCRHGLTPLDEKTPRKSERPPRAFAGRTRLIWTKKDPSQSESKLQRSAYVSMITGEKIENGAQRRPRLVKVVVRLNGKLVSVDDKVAARHESSLQDALTSDTSSDAEVAYSSRMIRDAIDRCLSMVKAKDTQSGNDLTRNAQCSLDLDRFHENVATTIGESYGQDNAWQPPRLDCVAGEEGDTIVVCTSPGRFDTQTIEQSALCTSCLRLLPIDNKSAGVCRRCVATVNAKSIQCQLCTHDSGEVRPGTLGPEHDVCGKFRNFLSGEEVVCQLCSRKSSGVVRCAADRCQVVFHPWCASVSSKFACLSFPRDHIASLSDAFLCTQYTCSQLELGAPPASSRRRGQNITSPHVELPVLYCGFHNPERSADCIGLYPGAWQYADAVQVPPRPGCS